MKVYGQLIRAQGENVSTLPTAGVRGRVVFLTTDSRIYVDDGTNFKPVVLADSTDTFTNKTFVANGTGNSLTNVANANIAAAAAIALNKLAATTASRALVSDASGFVSAATVTATQLGYLSTTTGDVQVALDAKQLRSTLTTKGDLYAATASATVARQAVGGDGQVLTADSTKSTGLTWTSPAAASYTSRNYLYNSEFRFFQRQTPGTLTTWGNGGKTGCDRWGFLTSAFNSNGQFARRTDTSTVYNTPYSLNVRQTDASSWQFGVYQVIPSAECRSLRGKTVTLSFAANTDGTEVPTIRAGIIEYTGTADNGGVPINTWAATPTLTSGNTYSNTPADISLTSTLATTTITATLGTTFTNLIVFIWTPSALAANNDFYLKEMQLVTGAVPIPYENLAKNFHNDLSECQRFYEKTYNIDVAPGTVDVSGAYLERVQLTSTPFFPMSMKVVKFQIPTVVCYSPSTGASGKWREATTGTDVTATVNSSGVASPGTSGFAIACTPGTSTNSLQGHWTADAEFQ